MVRNGVLTQNHISLGISSIFNKMKYFMSLIFCARLTVENNSSIPSSEPILQKKSATKLPSKKQKQKVTAAGNLK